MSNRDLEERLVGLEMEFANFRRRMQRYGEHQSLEIAALEVKAGRLEERIKDMDALERLLYDTYIDTHPKAQDTLFAIYDNIVRLPHAMPVQTLENKTRQLREARLKREAGRKGS